MCIDRSTCWPHGRSHCMCIYRSTCRPHDRSHCMCVDSSTCRPHDRSHCMCVIIMDGMAVFYVAGYLIEERRRWPVITASPRGQCSK